MHNTKCSHDAQGFHGQYDKRFECLGNCTLGEWISQEIVAACVGGWTLHGTNFQMLQILFSEGILSEVCWLVRISLEFDPPQVYGAGLYGYETISA